MQSGVDDLLPLFLGEAKDRLERITLLLDTMESDEEARLKVRRELHALKGASRMMRLTEISDFCHRAEELAERHSSDDMVELVGLVDRVVGLVSALQGGGGKTHAAASSDAAGGGDNAMAPPEARVPRKLLDGMTDRGARVRVLAVRAKGLVDRLAQLGRIAEAGVNDSAPQQVMATLASEIRQLALEFEGGQRNLVHHADRQLDALLRLQVQPLRPFLLGLARHARELARSMDKRLEVEVDAGDSQLDSRIIQALEEAFLHMVRNAVDHGIEQPARRLEAGKPEAGRLVLRSESEGNRVRIDVEDDGGGVDPQLLLEVATRRGLVSREEAARMSPDEVLQLLFQAGFSTREQASEVSGRGVGMDAVAEAVRRVGGDLWIDSALGVGTRISVEVPMARRGEKLLVMRVGTHEIGLPASATRGFRLLTPEMIVVEDERRLVTVNGKVVAAHFLGELLGEERTTERVLVEGMVAGHQIVLVADAVVGEEEVLLRPLPAMAGAPAVFDSMALLASGRPVAVLSPYRIARREMAQVLPERSAAVEQTVRILLVDDSLVTREMIRRLLEDGGFAVTPVSGAEQALRLLGEREFDCLVTDIEMPGMDGLELTQKLRDTPNLANLPVVVVSTRDRPQDRLAGLEAGADAYLAKQSLEARELVALIHRVGGRG